MKLLPDKYQSISVTHSFMVFISSPGYGVSTFLTHVDFELHSQEMPLTHFYDAARKVGVGSTERVAGIRSNHQESMENI